MARHLILEQDEEAARRREIRVQLACADDYVPFVQADHTYLAAMTTCTDCLAVQAARVAVHDALHGGTQ